MSNFEYHRLRCRVIFSSFIEEFGRNQSLKSFEEILEIAEKRRRLRDIRYLDRDLTAWARSLPENISNKINERLMTLGIDSLNGDNNLNNIVSGTIQKGVITNGEHAIIINNYLTDFSDLLPEEEIKILEKAIIDFAPSTSSNLKSEEE